MQAAFNNIVQHLFHQPSLHSVTVDELENMAEQYPYFAAAHFLLLKKMQDTSHAGFSEQLLKTTLYFNNPLWLQYLLQPESVGNFNVLEKSPFIASEHLHADNSVAAIQHEEKEIVTTKEPEIIAATNNIIPQQEELPVVASAGIMDVITEVFNDEKDEKPVVEATVSSNTIEVSNEKNIAPDISAEQDSHLHEALQTDASTETEKKTDRPDYESIIERIRQANKSESAAKEQQAPIATTEEKQTEEPIFVKEDQQFIAETGNEVSHSTINHSTETQAEEVSISFSALFVYNIPTIEEKQQETEPVLAVEEVKPAQLIQEPVSPALFLYDIPGIEEIQQPATAPALIEERTIPEQVVDQTVSPVLFKYDIPGIEAIEKAQPLDEFKVTDKEPDVDVTSILSQQLSSIKNIIETPAAKDDVLFEPFHTVDYFASQGIKLSKLDANPKDKLGKQLKSFTEWLKSMKKLPQVSIDKILSENDESKVVADAIHSIENKEVITEAMAEVFEKQGLFDRAASVYQKLSLLNPDKSAYFAAKIDALKQN